MPFFLPVRVDDCLDLPGFRLSAFPEYDGLYPEPHDAFGPLAEITELPAGSAASLLPEGTEDPRPLMAAEPDLMFYVADDGHGTGCFFAGFDVVPEPSEIAERRFVVASEEHGVGDPVWSVGLWQANADADGELTGLTPAEWTGITRLRVGESVGVGGGAGVLFTVKRVRDASSPLVSPDARFRYPESRSPEEEYSHNELWNSSRTADDRLGWDAEPWAEVLALDVGESYRFPGNEHVSGGAVERVR
jgi:hypothetical protein